MVRTIEQLSAALAGAAVNDRFCFALTGEGGAPHYFRIQKLHLSDDPGREFDLYALADDEGLRARVYSVLGFMGPDRGPGEQRLAVARILFDYLCRFYEEVSTRPPFGDRREADRTARGEAFEAYLACGLADAAPC